MRLATRAVTDCYRKQFRYTRQFRSLSVSIGTRHLFSPLRNIWRRFSTQSVLVKCAVIAGSAVGSASAYIAICAALQWYLEGAIDQLFLPHEDYPLEEWAHVEPTLREGDVILLMGTGPTSYRITLAQLVYSLMNPTALRYSHVGVVVEPAQLERWPTPSLSSSFSSSSSSSSSAAAAAAVEHSRQLSSSPGSIAAMLRNERSMLQRKTKRGVLMMEAVDNLDVNAPDVNGKIRHECVQVVEANRRLFGREGERWCYSRFAVRRLKGFDWTPQRKRLLRDFVAENVGRPLDKSPSLLLSYMHPRLYERLGGRVDGREICCGELIAELYKHCGVIQKHMRWEPATDAQPGDADVVTNADGSLCRARWYFSRPSIQTAPCHFAEGMEVNVIDFAEGVSLGAEVRMTLPGVVEKTERA